MAQLHIPILVNWNDIKDHMAKSDIVEVVRCKYCKWREGEELCGRHGFFVGLDLTFFCKSGERKDDEPE